MINRVGDYGFLPNNTFDKLANIIQKKEDTKLVDIVDSEKHMELIKKELMTQGYKVRTENVNNKWRVYAIMPDKIDFSEAVDSGAFKKLAWGRYSLQKESAIGMFNYDFDEGSIWREITGEDGQQYLVKEVDDEDEDEVIRQTKFASNSENKIINDKTIKNALQIVYDNYNDNKLVDDIIASNLKNNFFELINSKLDNLLESEINKNHFLQSTTAKTEMKDIVRIALADKLDNKEKLSDLLKQYHQETNNLSSRIFQK